MIEKLDRSAGLQRNLIASNEDDSDEEQDVVGLAADPPSLDQMPESESPLDHTGPIPPEYQRDPYAVEVFPLPTENTSSASPKPRVQIQERLLWASTVVVSWSITVVAILKVLGIL
jgi:hypothetical protein